MKCHDCKHVDIYDGSPYSDGIHCTKGHWTDVGAPPEKDETDDEGNDPWENCTDYEQK